jgi:hypothetical protein
MGVTERRRHHLRQRSPRPHPLLLRPLKMIAGAKWTGCVSAHPMVHSGR